MSYNLNENVDEYFDFQINGNIYRMRYPTSEEIRKAQPVETTEALNEGNITGWLHALITPQTEDAQDIEVALQNSNIKVIKNFNHMVASEFGFSEKVS